MFASRIKSALKSEQTAEKSSPWLHFQVMRLTCTRWGSIYSAISSQVFTHSGANTFALLSVRQRWAPSSSVGANRSLFVVKKPPLRDESPCETSTPRIFWWVKTYETKTFWFLEIMVPDLDKIAPLSNHTRLESVDKVQIHSEMAPYMKFCSMKKLYSVMYVSRALQ